MHQRKVFRLHGLQRELALAAFENDFALAGFEGHGLVTGHGAQNVDQLARTDGGGEVAGVATQFCRGADLDFEVAGGELQGGAGLAQQYVGKNGQGVAALDNTGHRLQNR